MSAARSSVPRRALVAFGLSGLAQNVMGTCLGVHLFMFYTDVVGLAPLWVSAGLFVATLWDAVSDVWMGRLSDRTRLKAGRRRPYVLLGALPVAVAFVLLLSPPGALSGTSLGLYFVVVLVLLFTAKTVVHVPALSLLPEMARGYHDRTRMAASRELFGNLGDLLGLLLPLAMMLAVGLRGDDQPGAQGLARQAFGYAAAIGGGVALLALVLTWRGTYEDPDARPADTDLREAFSALRANRAFRSLLGASCLAALGLAFVQSLILYVLEHVLEESDPAVHLSAFVVNAVSAIASYPFWTWLAKRRGKPFAFRLGLLTSSLAFGSVFFVGPGDLGALYVVMVFAGVANVGFWMLMHALSADVVDLDELEHGVRREGLFAGFAALVRKGAFAAAAGGVGIGLTVIGYRENAAQTADTVLGLKLLFAVPPTLAVLGAYLVFRRFPLTPRRHAEVRAALARRPRAPRAELRDEPSVPVPEAA